MGKPITPLCGSDVFITDADSRVLLVRRADNGYWALPGGCQNLDDTPAQCAIRECREECGLEIRIQKLLGVWSSLRYEYVHFPWKEDVFTHVLFAAEVIGGSEQTSAETTQVGWFRESELPPLSDGHEPRIRFGFQSLKNPELQAYFE